MEATGSAPTRQSAPLRLWPGLVAALAIVVARFVLPFLVPDATLYGIVAGVAGGLVIVLWWLFFSRAPWLDRLAPIVLIPAAALATYFIVHPSIAGGMMSRMLPVYLLPSTVFPAFVAGAWLTRRSSDLVRRLAIVGAIGCGCAVWALARTDGVKGATGAQLTWRWTPTAEERLLAHAHDEPAAPPAAAPASPESLAVAPVGDSAAAGAAKKEGKEVKDAAAAGAARPAEEPSAATVAASWPGFRGPARDGVVPAIRIDTDWAHKPPVEVWRRPIGPGWSSFAVRGDLLYTQEQRGEEEVVSAYRMSSGEPVWRHRDAVRFYESNGGAGPRGTPAVHEGRVFALGATGILNALDAATGTRIWSRNAAVDTGKELPGWGFASSPLAYHDLVIVAVAGRLIAYEAATGQQRWIGEPGGGGYSSPHLATLDGVPQVLLQRGARTISVAPADGTLLWEHSWQPAVSIVQPAVIADGVLITIADMMGGQGMRRLAVARRSGTWTVEERWTSRGLKPYFNDFVVHKGYAFGFDGTILSCVDLADGERKWKGGRYGAGQAVLLPEQDALLVLSEDGELAIVSATPDKFAELARFKAIEGKTWNHPALVSDLLLVRNGEEMAAFRLTLSGGCVLTCCRAPR